MEKRFQISLSEKQLDKLKTFCTRNKTKSIVIGQLIDYYYAMEQFKKDYEFPVVYSINEVADIFKVTRKTIHMWISEGKIDIIKVDKRVFITHEEVENMFIKYKKVRV